MHCDIDNPCLKANICQNGGICYENCGLDMDYECNCTLGFTGKNCTDEVSYICLLFTGKILVCSRDGNIFRLSGYPVFFYGYPILDLVSGTRFCTRFRVITNSVRYPMAVRHL